MDDKMFQMKPLYEDEFKKDRELMNQIHQKKILMEQKENYNPLDTKKELFSKALVMFLYENIVYKENFEIEETDRSSFKFANKIINSKKVINDIISNTINSLPQSITENQLVDLAEKRSDELTEFYVQDCKMQMIDIVESIDNTKMNNRKLLEESVYKKYPLYHEYKRLNEVKENNDADLSNAIISKMTDLEKVEMSIKTQTFKKCLESIGVKIDKNLDNKINEEFKNNLYLQ